MAKKKKESFNPKGFSLVIKHGIDEEIIEIPYRKQNHNKEIIGGKETYQMAIDAFTIRFKDENSLINFIRDNNMANISDIPNDKISVSMEYFGDDEFVCNKSIVYSDNEELALFIKNNLIREYFPPSLDSYPERFRKEIIDRLKYDLNYRIFMSNFNGFYGMDLSMTIKSIIKKDVLDDDFVLKPVHRYHNIRGNCIAKKDGILDLILDRIAYNNLSFEEQSEKENIEKLREIEREERRLAKKSKRTIGKRTKKIDKEKKWTQMQIDLYFTDEQERNINSHSPHRC